MENLGFKPYLNKEVQGPIITTFLYPDQKDIKFKEAYDYLKSRGYVIYPGKLTEVDSFRIGNIGKVDNSDMNNVIEIFKNYLNKEK